MKKILIFVLLWVVIVNLFALLALNRINISGDTAYRWINQENSAQVKSWDFTKLHTRWDSFYYTDIASGGYRLNEGETLSNVVFFPLYPLLIWTVSFLTLGSYSIAGWLISVLSLMGSTVVLHRLIRDFHKEIKPELAIYYLLIFPTAFFFSAVYTESLFLLLSLLTIYFSKKNNFWLAGTIGLLAALTRVTGFLLILPVLWEMWSVRSTFKKTITVFLSPLLIPLGTILFSIYHFVKFGDIALFFKVQSAWGRSFNFNEGHFSFFSNPAISNLTLDLMFVVFALIITYSVFRKKWISYGLYMLASISVALSTGTLMSIGRYILVLFPTYIYLASINNDNLKRTYALFSTLLLALYITLFANGYWAG